MTEAERLERAAIDEGLEQLAKGWEPAEIVVVLAEAAKIITDADLS